MKSKEDKANKGKGKGRGRGKGKGRGRGKKAESCERGRSHSRKPRGRGRGRDGCAGESAGSKPEPKATKPKRKAKKAAKPEAEQSPEVKQPPSKRLRQKPAGREVDVASDGIPKEAQPKSALKLQPAGAREPLPKQPKSNCTPARRSDRAAPVVTPPKPDKDALKKLVKPFSFSVVVPNWSRGAVGLKVMKTKEDGSKAQSQAGTHSKPC